LALRDVALREQLVVAVDGRLRERERGLRFADVRDGSRDRGIVGLRGCGARARLRGARLKIGLGATDARLSAGRGRRRGGCLSLRLREHGAGLIECGSERGRVDAREHLTLLHVRVEVDVDFGERPGHLRADADRVLRIDCAGCGHALHEIAPLDRNRRVRDRICGASAHEKRCRDRKHEHRGDRRVEVAPAPLGREQSKRRDFRRLSIKLGTF